MKLSSQRSLTATITSVSVAFSLFSAFGAERVAFVIGNDAYPTVPLENAVRDATAFRDMLTRDLGFATEDVVFMTNSSRLAIFEQFETFKKKTAGARIVLVFYAGHGMESLSGKENFILPVDANVMQAVESEAALRASGINIMTLTKELGEVSDAAKIFLVDACRERPQGRGIARTGGGLVAYADDQMPADTLMILAAAPKGLASDGEKHGPFTAALLDILPKGGQDLMSAFFAVSDRVQEVTQKQQIPWLKFDGSGAIFRANSFLKASVPGEPPMPLPMAPPPVEQKDTEIRFTQADLALPHRWIDAQGRETEAVFCGILGRGLEAVVLLKTANGKTGQYPLAKLSLKSNEMARSLNALNPGLENLSLTKSVSGPMFPANRPLENTLGMKFVPLPGTKVLFSTWETRVQDYTEYAKSNQAINSSWKNVSYNGDGQSPDHPVVNVSWQDAKDFCNWLSKRENRIYRLPTDHEWSVAVGIGDRESEQMSPTDKNGKIPGVYSWGNRWPPPPGSENLAGAESKFIFGTIPGYRDQHPFTSPVGSYSANSLGIFDLGGNVWEWCEDSDREFRMVRGAAWHLPGSIENASKRVYCDWDPDERTNVVGFRCVLEIQQK